MILPEAEFLWASVIHKLINSIINILPGELVFKLQSNNRNSVYESTMSIVLSLSGAYFKLPCAAKDIGVIQSLRFFIQSACRL